MGNPLKQLAGETAIYGLSTILARIINFLFVPVYTRCLTTESYGVVTEFMAYIAVLQVVLVFGLETGCFRFANRQGVRPEAVYSNALGTVFGINAAFLALVIAFAGPIASWLGYSGYENCIMYTGGILALDSITAILFARLRPVLGKGSFARDQPDGTDAIGCLASAFHLSGTRLLLCNLCDFCQLCRLLSAFPPDTGPLLL